jgi:hypothetical protein
MLGMLFTLLLGFGTAFYRLSVLNRRQSGIGKQQSVIGQK